MASWQEVLAPYVRDVEKRFDALKYALAYRLGGPDPIKIVPYRGYGTPEKLYLKGRVLEKQGVTPPEDNDSLWENLLNTFKRLESDEVPHARLAVRFQTLEQEVVADDEGMFEVSIAPPAPLEADGPWQAIELELLEPLSDEQEGPVRATGRVFVPPPSAHLAVISDIDDTVIQTDAADLLRMARTVFLGNARTRLPFPGVAAFYRALQAGRDGAAHNPLFYVSNSLWNLYDLLSEFFRLHDIPPGPTFLRNWGIYEDELLPTDQRKHKLALIRPILDLYRELPFILVGDSGEADPEIYHQLVHEYPGRIVAVYIRNVSDDLARSDAIHALAKEVMAAQSTLILAPDSLTMAQHAAEQGWIAPDRLPDIRAEKERDEAPPGTLEKLLGAEPPEGPTIEVDAPDGEGQEDGT